MASSQKCSLVPCQAQFLVSHLASRATSPMACQSELELSMGDWPVLYSALGLIGLWQPRFSSLSSSL